MMRVETGSRNDVQEASEMQRIEPLFLGSHPGHPDELACDAVRVLGCTSMFDAWLLTMLIRKDVPVQKGGAQLRCSSIGARQELQ